MGWRVPVGVYRVFSPCHSRTWDLDTKLHFTEITGKKRAFGALHSKNHIMDSRFAQKGGFWNGIPEANADDNAASSDGEGGSSVNGSDCEHDSSSGSNHGDSEVEVDSGVEAGSANEGSKKTKSKSSRRSGVTADVCTSTSASDDNDDDDDNKTGEAGTRNVKNEKKEKKAKKEEKSALRKEAQDYRDKLGQRGVLYLSRVPRNMNPTTVREHLEAYGEITRIYLAEEESSIKSKAKAAERGANKHAYFNEGWIEFSDKKLAKRIAFTLNNTPISNKKGSKHYSELWNLKYLHKFQWDYLTEKFAYERRVREAKIKASMLQAKKDNAEFAELVERGKTQKHVQERMSERKRKAGDSGSGGGDQSSSASSSSNKRVRKFRQNAVLDTGGKEHSRLIGTQLLSKVWNK